MVFIFTIKMHLKTEYEKIIAGRATLRRQRLAEVKKREENINNKMFNYYFKYSSPSNIVSQLSDAKGELNKEQVYFINKQLTKIKNIEIKLCLKIIN